MQEVLMKIDWRTVIVGGLMGVIVAGCTTQSHNDATTAALQANDPDARTFQGTIVSLRPTTSTMLISKDEHHGRDAYPNIVTVKWDAKTKFYLDGQPTTLDRLQQYMPVQLTGHMRQGEMFAEAAKFSSALPAKVIPAPNSQAQN